MRGSTGMSGAIEVGIIMGSRSDWDTMRHAAETLDALGVPHECKVVSAHRTPQRLYDYATSAVSRGLKVMDTTAFTLSQENELPIVVFDMNKQGNLMKIVSGENIGTVVNL